MSTLLLILLLSLAPPIPQRPPSGAAVPGTEVTIANTATNSTRRFTTTDSGLHSSPLLPPDAYRINVE